MFHLSYQSGGKILSIKKSPRGMTLETIARFFKKNLITEWTKKHLVQLKSIT